MPDSRQHPPRLDKREPSPRSSRQPGGRVAFEQHHHTFVSGVATYFTHGVQHGKVGLALAVMLDISSPPNQQWGPPFALPPSCRCPLRHRQTQPGAYPRARDPASRASALAPHRDRSAKSIESGATWLAQAVRGPRQSDLHQPIAAPVQRLDKVERFGLSALRISRTHALVTPSVTYPRCHTAQQQRRLCQRRSRVSRSRDRRVDLPRRVHR